MHIKLSALILFSMCALCLRAENWPNWRGPFYNGTTDETGLPDKLVKGENTAWVTPMPGASGATPIVWGDKIFVSSTNAKTKNLDALCIDRKTGKVIWQKEAGTGDRNVGRESNMASPSPVTDGKTVIFLYGTGDLTAFDFDGKELWRRNITKDHGNFAIMWGYGSSPTLHKGKLYVLVLQRDKQAYSGDRNAPAESYILAIDPANGKDLWKTLRKDNAAEESKESYGTIIPAEFNGRPELLVAGGDCMTGHDPETGREFWRFGGWNPARINHWRLVSSPAFGDGMIWISAPKGGPLFAVKAGGNGDITQSHLAWKFTEKRTPDVCTPLYYQGLLYLADEKVLTCIDPKTGEKKWQQPTGVLEVYRASPAAGDGKIYTISRNGQAHVLKAGPEYSVLSQSSFDDGTAYSSIAISQGNVFVRTANNLYCFKK